MSEADNLRTVLLTVREIPPRRGEGWRPYRRRIAELLEPVRWRAAHAAGLRLMPLLAANALYGEAPDEVVRRIRTGLLGPGVSLIEWGEELAGGQMRGVAQEVGPGAPPPWWPDLTGRGVSVAVLDSGIDARHPCLDVTAAVSTCPEPAGVPGWHGTYCAGLIASRSPQFPGLAPGARLLDIKVSRSGGWLHPSWLARGIDAALDAKADILSISVGLNRIPTGVTEGHGWDCPDGRCILCRAVDHAVRVGALVIAAAGNQHLRVRSLRQHGVALPPSAELLCPGGARQALTVGALSTRPTVQLWPASSRGVHGSGRPQLVAPGVGLASTVPIPDNGHTLDPLALFGTGTGTSVATAVTAGAAALIYERRKTVGLSFSPRSIHTELLAHCLPLSSQDGVPLRRLDLSTLHTTNLSKPGAQRKSSI